MSTPTTPHDPRLAKALVLDELFDLTLYRSLHGLAGSDLQGTLNDLVAIETKHLAFWQSFFDIETASLDFTRRFKLGLIIFICRLFGPTAIHLVLEAIEVYGVRKYLSLWGEYKDGPLGGAVRGILVDEFKHEDAAVTRLTERKINPDRIRNIFLGLNDGLVEILGAVSGFFAALGTASLVLVAGLTTAVAGALSMAAGAYVAIGSENEVRRTQLGKERFLGEVDRSVEPDESALKSSLVVGVSYFAGAAVPILPVLFGAESALISAVTGGLTVIVVSTVLAFLSGMNVRNRILTNLVIIAAAVGVTYGIGMAVRNLFGVAL